MRVLSPMSAAIFLFWFGMAGVFMMHYFSALGQLSLAPAAVASFVATTLTQKMMGAFLGKLKPTGGLSLEQSIGTIGELTVSIPENGTGEVLFMLGDSRCNYPAKAAKAGATIKRATRVVILNIENRIVYVEPYDDLMSESQTLSISAPLPAPPQEEQA